jgi:hypothetical protein
MSISFLQDGDARATAQKLSSKYHIKETHDIQLIEVRRAGACLHAGFSFYDSGPSVLLPRHTSKPLRQLYDVSADHSAQQRTHHLKRH